MTPRYSLGTSIILRLKPSRCRSDHNYVIKTVNALTKLGHNFDYKYQVSFWFMLFW